MYTREYRAIERHKQPSAWKQLTLFRAKTQPSVQFSRENVRDAAFHAVHKVTNATNVVSSLRNEPIVAILDTLWNCCTLESGTLENSSSFFRIEITDGLIICEKYLSPVFYS